MISKIKNLEHYRKYSYWTSAVIITLWMLLLPWIHWSIWKYKIKEIIFLIFFIIEYWRKNKYSSSRLPRGQLTMQYMHIWVFEYKGAFISGASEPYNKIFTSPKAVNPWLPSCGDFGWRIKRKFKGWNGVMAKGYTVCVSHGNSRWCLSSSWWFAPFHFWIFTCPVLYQHSSHVCCVKGSYHRVCGWTESYACFQETCVGCSF